MSSKDTPIDYGDAVDSRFNISLDQDQLKVQKHDSDTNVSFPIGDSESIDKALAQAITYVGDLLEHKNISNIEEINLNDINFHLSKAIVGSMKSQIEDLIDGKDNKIGAYETSQNNAQEIAYAILPRLKLISEINDFIKRYHRTRDDPDYNRCIFNLKNMMGFLMSDVEPHLQSLNYNNSNGSSLINNMYGGEDNEDNEDNEDDGTHHIKELLRLNYSGGAESETESDSDSNQDGGAESESDSDSDQDGGAGSESDSDSNQDGGAGSESESDSDSEQDGGAGSDSDSDQDGGAESDSDSDQDGGAGSESESESDSEQDGGAGSESESESESDSEQNGGAGSESESESESDSDQDGGAGSESESDSEQDGGAGSESESDSDSEQDGGAGSESESDSDSEQDGGAGSEQEGGVETDSDSD